ncbi:MAG TPA: dynamin family protein [Nocardioides sp.]|nr:dynamin family protein [Nocardioides sp.]
MEHLAVADGAAADVTEASAVRALRDALDAAVLPLDLPGSREVREQRELVLDQIGDYLLPRLRHPERPLLVVVGGPTGVGKSTLVNALVGERVTRSGLIRPTTRSPVLVHHPEDARWFAAARDGVLPTFERVATPTDDPGKVELAATTAVPRGVALLDAPDFDSIDETNRLLATRLLAAADMWLFVTSANRYADEVPWGQLEVARRRSTPLLVVLNRIRRDDLELVSTDLVRQLRGRGIARGKVVVVEHGEVVDGLLRSDQVDGIRSALRELSEDPVLRRDVAADCATGALRAAVRVATEVADAAALQVGAIGQLLEVVDREYDAASASLAAALSGGALVRGDLAQRWSDLVGTHVTMPAPAALQRMREHVLAQPDGAGERALGGFEVALDLALEALVVDRAEQAATSASRALRATVHGEALLAWSEEDLSRPGRRVASQVRRAIARWRAGLDVTDGASDVGSRLLAVALAVGALMTPSDHDAARNLQGPVAAARTSLGAAMTALLAAERDRYLGPVARWNLAPDAPARLRAAVRAVEDRPHRSGGRRP